MLAYKSSGDTKSLGLSVYWAYNRMICFLIVDSF